MLINDDKKIFVGKRIDNQSDAWQMPQGGIDAGEDEDFAMFRELQEETGINEKLVNIIKKSENYFYYNLPYKLQKKFWGGKYLGQKQRWYLLKYIGDDSMINIKLIEPEFSEWKWVEKDELVKLIVNFKRELYKNIISEFKNYI
jgi:putative (di)nucleoside polyphosphate hydrolase